MLKYHDFFVPPASRDACIHGIGILTQKNGENSPNFLEITGTNIRDPEITTLA